ncbi:MAG: hypothetical protein AAF557_21620 [Pseudomonadota bacterium]
MSDKDWELANAYHDGELDLQDAKEFEARLRNEPELAAHLDRVKSVSRSLSALRPATVEPLVPSKAENNRPKWFVAAAVAASLLVAAVLSWPEKTEGVPAIHQAFLDQSFSVNPGAVHPVATRSTLPDLGAANLTYVASRETDIGTAAHYAGQNGCRLTILTMAEPAQIPAQSDLQVLQWEIDDHHFAIVASGMDAGKFSAIAAYLQQETRRAIEEEAVLALREATQNATNCA